LVIGLELEMLLHIKECLGVLKKLERM
jgi:hypothetical protein